jgi:hypothetical protein
MVAAMHIEQILNDIIDRAAASAGVATREAVAPPSASADSLADNQEGAD